MDLHLLENIIAIDEEKSITRAAEKQFLTQSALNQQLQKLEEQLGAQLFTRSRGNWQPTEAGKIYLAAARSMMLLKKDAYQQIADCVSGEQRLVIGLLPERGMGMFTAVYPAFHAAFPQVQIEPMECSVHQMQQMITDGRMDLGLVTIDEAQRDENVYHVMADEEIVLAVPKEIAQAVDGSEDYRTAQETDLARFADQPFARIHQDSTLYGICETLFRQANFAPHVLFYSGSNFAKHRMAALGLGCALLPCSYAARDERVVYFRLKQHPGWQITLCSRKNGYLGKPAQYFLTLCKRYWQEKMQ